MKATTPVAVIVASLFTIFLGASARSGIRGNSDEPSDQLMTPSSHDSSASGVDQGSADLPAATGTSDSSVSTEKADTNSSAPKKGKEKKERRAEAFIAGPSWEFDGFIAGGQDQQVKSMFTTNDLVYLNIGLEQGLTSGERLGVYRRGEVIRDPHSGSSLGYEVRKISVIEVTDRLDAKTCSCRVITAYEPCLIGDLVRRE